MEQDLAMELIETTFSSVFSFYPYSSRMVVAVVDCSRLTSLKHLQSSKIKILFLSEPKFFEIPLCGHVTCCIRQ